MDGEFAFLVPPPVAGFIIGVTIDFIFQAMENGGLECLDISIPRLLISGALGGGAAKLAFKLVGKLKRAPHKNSLDYVGQTHVYRVKGPNGTHKIGESAQGTRVRDGESIRGEQQARRLTRETGNRHSSEIRKTFSDKASARRYETRLIERFRRMYGDDTLPGNKTNR